MLPEYDVEALDLYLICPLRYFYEYPVGLSDKAEDSAYLRFHHCLHEGLRWMMKERAKNNPIDEQALQTQLDNIWADHGPVGYPFEAVYKKNAEVVLANALHNQSLSHPLADNEPRKVKLPSGYVKFTPDQVEKLDDGSQILRRTRTGKIGTSEKGKNIYALYQSSIQGPLGLQSKIEVLSLSTGDSEPVVLSQKMVDARLNKYDGAIQGILEQQFSPTPLERECPRCPYYFICTSTDQT